MAAGKDPTSKNSLSKFTLSIITRSNFTLSINTWSIITSSNYTIRDL